MASSDFKKHENRGANRAEDIQRIRICWKKYGPGTCLNYGFGQGMTRSLCCHDRLGRKQCRLAPETTRSGVYIYGLRHAGTLRCCMGKLRRQQPRIGPTIYTGVTGRVANCRPSGSSNPSIRCAPFLRSWDSHVSQEFKDFDQWPNFTCWADNYRGGPSPMSLADSSKAAGLWSVLMLITTQWKSCDH